MRFATDPTSLSNISARFIIEGLHRPEFRAIVNEVLTETGRHNKRSCPIASFFVVSLVISLALFRAVSTVKVFDRLMRWSVGPRLGARPVTPEALFHARDRLGVIPLKMLHGLIVSNVLAPVPATFHGRRLWGIDGSEFTTPDTPSNLAAFGKHYSDRGEAAYPQVRGVTLTALVTHHIHDACFVPSKCSERACTRHLMRKLGPQDLLMVDRGLASFVFMRDCLKRECSFIVRIGANWKPRHLRTLAKGDVVVELVPSKEAKSKLPKHERHSKLVLRLVTFVVGGSDEIKVLTNLPSGIPALDIAGEYHRRWECELVYKEVKLELLAVTEGKQKTHLRSKSPKGVLQELWGALVAHTLIRELMVEGAQQAGVSPLEMSFSASVEVITQSLPIMQAAPRRHHARLRAALIREIACCVIIRPRRNRQFPRKVKRKMSNFGLKGFNDREKALDIGISLVSHPQEAHALEISEA